MRAVDLKHIINNKEPYVYVCTYVGAYFKILKSSLCTYSIIIVYQFEENLIIHNPACTQLL